MRAGIEQITGNLCPSKDLDPRPAVYSLFFRADNENVERFLDNLRDEAWDWSSRYHEYISVSRLRTFLREMDADAVRSFSQFAAALNSVSSAKWPNVEEVAHSIIAIRAIIPEIQNSSKITRGVILRNCLIKIEPLLPIFISPILHNNPDFERAWKAVIVTDWRFTAKDARIKLKRLYPKIQISAKN